MNNERFVLCFERFSESHEIIIKDTDGKNQASIIGSNNAITDNLENMKKINFLLNMLWNEIQRK